MGPDGALRVGRDLAGDLLGEVRRRPRGRRRSAASSASSASGTRRISARSTATSRSASSFCERTETYSPAAIENAPAARPATPASATVDADGRSAGHARDQREVGDQPVHGAEHRRPQPAPADVLVVVVDLGAGVGHAGASSAGCSAACSAGRLDRRHLGAAGSGGSSTASLVLLIVRLGLDHVLPARAQPRRHDEVDQPADERDAADPDVDADPADGVGLVDPHGLDQPAPGGVEDDVEGEDPSVPHPEPAVGPDQDPGHGDQPQRLVEERGVEGGRVGIAVGAMGRVDLQAPRQVGGTAEELLVEPVPPATHGLGEGEAREPARPRTAAAGSPRRRQPIQAPRAPKTTAPQMPRPPFQIRSASTGLPPSPK